MKSFAPLAVLALVAGVYAQDPDCDADYIVERCLTTENPKVANCENNDWDCLCAAYQAVATCFNNCPNDPRRSPAETQVTQFCQAASAYGSAAATTNTAAQTTVPTADTTPTNTAGTEADSDADADAQATESASPTDDPNGAGGVAALARNTGVVLLGIAGVMITLL